MPPLCRGIHRQPPPNRHFNSRTPCGVRLQTRYFLHAERRFQLTHSLRSATTGQIWDLQRLKISTHALLAECDYEIRCQIQKKKNFNSRTPCGVRLARLLSRTKILRFQLTHSLRSATRNNGRWRSKGRISTHALLAECDQQHPKTEHELQQFQLTHSLRSATIITAYLLNVKRISTHALLAECDLIFADIMPNLFKFQLTHSLRSATRQ